MGDTRTGNRSEGVLGLDINNNIFLTHNRDGELHDWDTEAYKNHYHNNHYKYKTYASHNI